MCRISGLEEFVTAYIEEKNTDIREHNIRVEELLASFQDLFS